MTFIFIIMYMYIFTQHIPKALFLLRCLSPFLWLFIAAPPPSLPLVALSLSLQTFLLIPPFSKAKPAWPKKEVISNPFPVKRYPHLVSHLRHEGNQITIQLRVLNIHVYMISFRTSCGHIWQLHFIVTFLLKSLIIQILKPSFSNSSLLLNWH